MSREEELESKVDELEKDILSLTVQIKLLNTWMIHSMKKEQDGRQPIE